MCGHESICGAGGIADALREASPIASDRPSTVVFATRMNGRLLARFENALNGNRECNNLYSKSAQWVPQYVLEDVLRRCAQSHPSVTIHFQTEFMSFLQTAMGVVATVRDLRTGVKRVRPRVHISSARMVREASFARQSARR